MRRLLAKIAGRAVERPAPVVAAAALLATVAAVGALQLQPDAGTDALVDKGSDAYAATERLERQFGDDAVVVLVSEDLEKLMLTGDLGTLLGLEACLAGTVPGGRVFGPGEAAPEPCEQIAAGDYSRVVYGPATFLNQFATRTETLLREQSQATLARARRAYRKGARRAREQGLPPRAQEETGLAAAQEVLGRFQASLLRLAVQTGQTGLPSLDNAGFVSSVVFDSRFAEPVPKARFSYLLPNSEAALVSVRLSPGLGDSERAKAIDLIREAAADPAFRLVNGDGRYVVSGVPVVVDGLASALTSELALLLVVALAVMALTLGLVFHPPLRLLPLAIAAGAAALAFGLLALFGGSLTMASVAVLPVLIGLAVDYAIQFQARFAEALRDGRSVPAAAVAAGAAGGPVIGAAMLATAAGFSVLLLSPIPMVRTFGVLLVVGVVLAFGLALTSGLAALSLVRGGRSGGRVSAAARRLREGAGARLAPRSDRVLAVSVTSPGRVLAAAAVLAVAGWAAGTRTEVVSDLHELGPAELPALSDVDELQSETGVSGQVDVLVTAPDLTDPEVIAWMAELRDRVLERNGFGGDFPRCLDEGTDICPAIALPDLFSGEDGIPGEARVDRVLELLPDYFEQAVLARDPETGEPTAATISFGIRTMPFDEQKQLIDGIRAAVDPPGGGSPPPGVEAEVAGLPVLVADANAKLAGNRYLLVVAGLAAVALALLAIYRSARRALVPLIPIVLATGWSALVVEAVGVPLNPMSATLGALVIAIATEFSVILSARYHSERGGGRLPGEALRVAYRRTGAPILASGATAIAGFAVLIATDIQMLRDFGLVTVLDLFVALTGVLLVLPAALVWAEGGFAPLGRIRGTGRSPAPAGEGAGDG